MSGTKVAKRGKENAPPKADRAIDDFDSGTLLPEVFQLTSAPEESSKRKVSKALKPSKSDGNGEQGDIATVSKSRSNRSGLGLIADFGGARQAEEGEGSFRQAAGRAVAIAANGAGGCI